MMTIEDLSEEMTHAQSAIEKFKHQVKKNLRELHSGFEKIVAEDPTFLEDIGTIITRYFVTEAAANAVAAIADKASNETLGNVFKMSTKFLFVLAFLVKDMRYKDRLDKAKKFIGITSGIGGIDQLSEFVANPLANRLHYLLIGCTDIKKLAFFFSGSITRMILDSKVPPKGVTQMMTDFFKRSISAEYTQLVKGLIADEIIPDSDSDLYEQKFLFIFSKNITVKYGKEDLELKGLLNNSPAIIVEEGSLCKNETDKLNIKKYCWLPAQRLSRTEANGYHDNVLPKLEITPVAHKNPTTQPSNIDTSQLSLLDEHYNETLTYVKTTGMDKLKDDNYVSLAKRLFEVRESLAQVIEDKTSAIIDYLLKYTEILYLYNYKLTSLQVWDTVDKLFLKKEIQFLENAVEALEEKYQTEKIDEVSLNWVSEHLGKLKILIGYNEAQFDTLQTLIRHNKKILDNYSMYLRFLELLDLNIIANEDLISTDGILNELKEKNQKGNALIDFHDLDQRLIKLIARATKPLIKEVDVRWANTEKEQKRKTLNQLIGSAEVADIKAADTRNLRNLQGILADLDVSFKDKTINEIESIGKKINATADKKSKTSKIEKQVDEVVTKIHLALLQNICKLITENKTEKLQSLLQSLSPGDKSIILNKIMQDKRPLEYALETKSTEEFYRVSELLIQYGADPCYVIYLKITGEQLKDSDQSAKKILKTLMKQISPTDNELELLSTNKSFFTKPTESLIETIKETQENKGIKQKFSKLSKLSEREFWLVISYISGTTIAQKLLLGSNKELFPLSLYQQLAKSTQEKFGNFYNCLYLWTKIFTGGDALGNVLVSHDYLGQHNSIYLMLKALEYPIGTYNESTLFYIIYNNDYYAIDYLASLIDGLERRTDSSIFFEALYNLILTPFIRSNYQNLNFHPHPKMLLTPITLAAYCGNLEALKLFRTIIEQYLSITVFENKKLNKVNEERKIKFLIRIKNSFSHYPDKLGCTALHYAALMSHGNVVDWLLNTVYVDTSCKTKFSPQYIQQKIGNINCEIDSEKKDLSWLLGNPDTQGRNERKESDNNNQDSEDVLASNGITPEGLSDEDEQVKAAIFQGYTALDYARGSHVQEKVKYPVIISINTRMNEVYKQHKKQFIESKKTEEIFRQARNVLALMPKVGNSYENTTLHKTSYEVLAQNPVGYFHVIFDLQAQSSRGDSSLFENIGTIDNQFLKIHLENNKSLIDQTNDCGVTLLMLAIYLKRRDIVETLIGLGANTQLSTIEDYTKTIECHGKKTVLLSKGSRASRLSKCDNIINSLVSQNAEQFLILNKFQEVIEQVESNLIAKASDLNNILLALIPQIAENEILKTGLEVCVRYTGDTLLHLLLQIYKWTNIRFAKDKHYQEVKKTLLKIASYITDKSIKALFWQHAQFGSIISNLNADNNNCLDFILIMAIEIFKKSSFDIIFSDEYLLKLATFICRYASNINMHDMLKHTPLQIMARHHLIEPIDEVMARQRLKAEEIKKHIPLDRKPVQNIIDEQHLNMQDVDHGLTALHYLCCWNDTFNIIKKLVALKANLYIATTSYFTLTFQEKNIKEETAKEQTSMEGTTEQYLAKIDANIEKAKHDLERAQRTTKRKNYTVQQFNQFLDAIRQNDIEVITALLEEVDINGREPTNKLTPLHHAAIHSSEEVVKMLLAAGADPELQVNGEIPSQWAEANERPENARLIEQARLDKQHKSGVNIVDTNMLSQNQPLEKVIEISAVPLDSVLGSQRVGSKFYTIELMKGTTPLILAAQLNNEKIVEVLLQEMYGNKAGIIHKDKDGTGHTAIYYAYIKELNTVLEKMLNNYRALSYFFSGLEGESADNDFLENLSKYRIDVLCSLFGINYERAMVFKQISLGYDKFTSSIQNNLFEIISRLRTININLPEIRNFVGINTLQLNSEHIFTMINSKNYHMIQYSLQECYKSLWLQTSDSEISPFHFLCYCVSYDKFDTAIFKKVLEFVKEEIKSPDESKRTALWYAILFGSVNVVELLLEGGASIGLAERFAALLYPVKNNTILHLIENKCLGLEKQSEPVPTILPVSSQPIAIPQVRQPHEGNNEPSVFSENVTIYIQQWMHFSPSLKDPVKQKLTDNVNAFGYQFLKVSGVGNCFFEAVLHHLINDSIFSIHTMETLLNTMVNHIVEYENDYQNYITDDLGKFIKELQQSPNQVGAVFIMALSRALKINIVIVHSDNEDPIVIKQNNSMKTILLCCGFNRYCALLPDSSKNKSKDLDILINQAECDNFDSSVEPQQTTNLSR